MLKKQKGIKKVATITDIGKKTTDRNDDISETSSMASIAIQGSTGGFNSGLQS